MFQENQPKPGAALSDLILSMGKLTGAIVLEGRGQGAEAEANLELLIAKVDLNVNPDDVKFLTDQLESGAAGYQIEADQQGHIAAMMSNAATTIRQRFAESLHKAGIDQIKGETWTAKVYRAMPRVEIDWPKLGSAGKEYFQDVPMVNEAKVTSAIAAGVEVPGVKIHCVHELEFFVEKKAAQ